MRPIQFSKKASQNMVRRLFSLNLDQNSNSSISDLKMLYCYMRGSWDVKYAALLSILNFVYFAFCFQEQKI